ncbi:Collagen alpha-6(VI) chain [Triplophysa tibetana]|uniref:Collagen alpha-6(VI) chain n=1 Tax=Triplophysa tibetana TaxID=1572043 RepID=A0A5A9PCD1_9TELE|nr:Collagen alpha-6(VI) chain [Triplophysa tibetana]
MNSSIQALESGSKTRDLADPRFHGPSTSQFTSARLQRPTAPEQDDDVIPAAVPRRTMGSAVPVSTGYQFFSPAAAISHQLRSQILAVCMQEAVADIVFLVDGSSSIRLENFQTIREFLSSLVSIFEVAPDKVRFGLVQYSDTPRTEFLLNAYQNKEDILNYIKNLSYKTGGTLTGSPHTGLGLEFLLNHHFVPKAGSRTQDNVPQIAIVITDGNSQDEVELHAQKLRERGIKLYAIGIKDADETLLRQIANRPYDQHVYSVSDFAALQGISQSVIHELCTTLGVSVTTKDCNETAQADVVVLVDSSRSIGEKYFAEVRKFLHTFVDKFNLRVDKVRLGLIQFSDKPYPEFLLGDYVDKKELHQKLDNLIYRKGRTNTGQALTFVHENYFNLARNNVPRIAIVITDGDSEDSMEEPAQKLRNQGVSIFIIKVGKSNTAKLRSIANSPHEEFMFSIDSYQELQGLQESLRNKLCFTISEQLMGFAPKFADLFILVDSLASKQESVLIRNFLQRLINQLSTGKDFNRIGLAQFSENVKEEFLLNTDKSRAEMVTQARSLQLKPTGQRKIGNAIEYARKHFLTTASGSRVSDGFKQFLLVVAAGQSDDKTVQAARSIKKDAVTVFAVGLPRADPDEMEDISSRPNSFRIINTNTAFQVQLKIKSSIEKAYEPVVTEECKLDVVADVAFIIDQSSSIRYRSFHIMRNFLNNVIIGLDVGKGKIKVALILYSDVPRADIYFNTYEDEDNILRYIQSIAYGSGNTNTGAALRFAKDKVFTKARGSRKDQGVQQVAIVITDGKSTDDVASTAAALRRSGVTVFALGIKETQESDLKEIASYPARKFVFNMEHFDGLNSLAKTLPRTLCNAVADAVIPVRLNAVEEGCKSTAEADIYFLLGESRSISKEDFDEMKKFIMEFLEAFEIAPDKVRIGVVKFADGATVSFRLNKYSTKSAVQQAVKGLIMDGSGTRTDLGLLEMISLFKDAAHTRAKKIRKLLIVITDGKSEDRGRPVKDIAEELRNMNVTIYAIGLKNVSMSELEVISGSKKRTFYAQNYDFLKKIRKEILIEICSVKACEGLLADVVFLIDGSESIAPEDFKKTKDLLEIMVANFVIGPDKERVAVVQYSTNTKREFLLNAFDDRRKIIQEIRTIQQMSGKTFTGKALKEVSQIFDESNGGRPKALKFLIVLTNGVSKDEVGTPAKDLRKNGTNIYSIGIGPLNRTELHAIAGSQERVFYEGDFESLDKLGSDVLLKICSTGCKRPKLMDVIFLLDGAGTPNKIGFLEMKTFMSNVVRMSEIGEKRVRFGLIVYSNTPHSEFTLNQYYKQADVESAVSNIKASGGSRNTAQALRYALTYFSQDHGGRRAKSVPQVLFLITDGKMDDNSGLEKWNDLLANSEVNLFAIGAARAREAELRTIAEGSRGKVLYVNDYQGLSGLQQQITRDLCNLTKPVCEKEMGDLVFLIDGSDSINYTNWVVLKQAMFSIVKELDIAPNNWRVGVSQFSHILRHEFDLKKYINLSGVNDGIQDIRKISEGTSTWMALKHIKESFTLTNGSRIDGRISQNLLLITDGNSNDAENEEALADLRAMNIEINVIGVGENINKSVLVKIAGTPDRVLIESFESLNLKTTVQKVLSLICNGESDEAKDCNIDIGIGFDVSRRATTQPLLRPHVELLVRAALLNVSVIPDLCCVTSDKNDTKIGYRIVSGQDDRVLEDFDFEKYNEDVARKVLLLRPAVPLAFNTFLLDSFREKFVRSTAKVKVLILFTDGLDDSIERLMASSEKLKHSGVSSLLIVSLEGVVDFHHLEFGRGFDYRQPLSINMLNVGNALMKQIESAALRKCCNVLCSCTGMSGPRGPPGRRGQKGLPGKMGYPGLPGDEGVMGEQGPPGLNGTHGHNGCRGNRGFKGQRGFAGNKGEDGENGLDGVDGEQGVTGLKGLAGPKGDPGDAGMKGFKGSPGPKGHLGVRGDPGSPGQNNRTPGLKGERGGPGLTGDEGLPGPKGDIGGKGDSVSDAQVLLGEEAHRDVRVSHQMKEVTRASEDLRVTLDQQEQMVIWGPQETEVNQVYLEFRVRPVRLELKVLKEVRDAEGRGVYPVTWGSKEIAGQTDSKDLRGTLVLQVVEVILGKEEWMDTGGSPGESEMPECELVEKIRNNCANGGQCPAYPTELVIALDMSDDVTTQVFEQMRAATLSLLEDISIAETTCPWGARVSVISYNSESKYLFRFSDHRQKKLLLEAVSTIPLQRTTKIREMGQAMLFVARNVFKRVRAGRLMRKVAVFFTNGPSEDVSSIKTAILEFKGADIGLGVVALQPARNVQLAVQVDDTRSFIVVDGEGVSRIKQCVICFDRCNPNPTCAINLNPEPLRMDMDLSVLMDSTDNLNSQQYLSVKDLTLSLLDYVDVSSEPSAADGKARVSVYQQSSTYGSSYIHEEFSFTAFKNRRVMKRHITDMVKQVGGVSRVEFALEWMITNVLLKAERPRKKQMIVAVFGQEHLDKAQLDYVSKLCKCQNVVLFIVMAGQKFDWRQMEKLTSVPLEQRLVFLGSARQRDREYAGRFINAFLHLLDREPIPRSDVPARECDAFQPRTVVFGQSMERDVVPIVPQTEEAQEEDEEEYTYIESFLNDYTLTEEHTEEHKEDPVEPSEIKKDVCQFDYDEGRCSEYSVKWYFNIRSGECLRFWKSLLKDRQPLRVDETNLFICEFASEKQVVQSPRKACHDGSYKLPVSDAWMTLGIFLAQFSFHL